MSNTEIPWLTDAFSAPIVDIFTEGVSIKLMQSPMRVLIADGRKRIRFGLRTLLNKQDNVEVVGEVERAEDLIKEIHAQCADLVLVDWGLPGLGDGAALEALQKQCPGTKLIVLSSQHESKAIALAAGADAFVDTTESPVILLSVIEDCCRREFDQAEV